MKSEPRSQECGSAGEMPDTSEINGIPEIDSTVEIKEHPHTQKAPKKLSFRQRYSIETLKNRIKHLNGDPHYVALGMAIGIFVALTPTIPFHMVLAVMLAILVKGSKAAAVIGVWFSNPLTIPIFYLASYKVGAFILGHRIPFDQKYDSILELAKIGFDTTVAMLLGGVVIGIFPAIFTYFLTKKVVTKYRQKKERKKASKIRTVMTHSDIKD